MAGGGEYFPMSKIFLGLADTAGKMIDDFGGLSD